PSIWRVVQSLMCRSVILSIPILRTTVEPGHDDDANIYLFFALSESESQPGVPETSNSGASAGLASGFAAAAGATALAGTFDAPAAAADAAGFAATGGFAGGFTAGAGFAAGAAFAAGTGFAAVAAFAFASSLPLTSGSGGLPRPSAYSTEARRSTSMRNGWPEEYSA